MKYIFVVALVALVLTACTPTDQTSDLSDPFIGGTKGLAISFENGAPPREIWDAGQMPFSVYVRVQNLGESPVGPDSEELSLGNDDNSFAMVQLIGINPAQFGYPETQKTFDEVDVTVDGAHRNFDGTIVAGTTDVVGFEDFSYLPDEHGNSQLTLRANVCYDYTSHSNTRVCIKDNLLENIQDNSICTLTGPKDPKNSGSPVHVTSVTQNPLGRNKIQVTFTIENVGTGRIFKRALLQGNTFAGDACDTGLANPNRDIVHVKLSLGDDVMTQRISCQQFQGAYEGFVPLREGTPATVSCTICVGGDCRVTDNRLATDRVYTDTLHIDLEYTYLDFVETPILIRDVSSSSMSQN
jgi:hypothetical protein